MWVHKFMKLKFSALLVVPLVYLGLIGSSLMAQSKGAYALKDAKIVRVSGPAIEHGTVVVRDGLIEAVGENPTIPADAWVIDCKGLTIYPGLIDSLSNWGMSNTPTAAVATAAGRGGGRAQVAAPTTPAVTAAITAATAPPARGPEDRPSNQAWVKAADQLFPTDRNIESARNGGFTSAVAFPTGNIFAGQGSVIDLAGERAGDMVLAQAVGQMITVPSGRGGGRGYPGSLMGVFAYIRQIYLDSEQYKIAHSIYQKNPQGLPRPAYDRTLEGLLASPRVLLPATREVEIERMLAFAKELGMNAVLYGGHEAWRAADSLKKANVPVLLSLKYPEKALDTDPAAEESLRVLELRDKAPNSAGALAKAGVKFAFYSDGVSAPRDLMRAVKKAIDAGLAPDAALRALTLTPAEIFNVQDRVGSIDKGKIANLVVADGDLFADRTKVKYVFVDGGKYEPVEEPAARPGGRGGRGAAGPAEGNEIR
jgi:imidazolonepropionase-like amidohydrolase